MKYLKATPTLISYFHLFHILTNYSRNFQFFCWNYLWCGILYTEENMNDHMHIMHHYWQVMKLFIYNSHILESLAISISIIDFHFFFSCSIRFTSFYFKASLTNYLMRFLFEIFQKEKTCEIGMDRWMMFECLIINCPHTYAMKTFFQ